MKTDVVVIGGGGAALCAALAAREEGAEVLILSKTGLGLGNCTAYSGGGFTLGVGGMDPAVHLEKTLETGRWLNERELVGLLAQEAPGRVLALEEYGVKMDIGLGKVSVSRYAPREILAGTAFTQPLVQMLEARGVQIREGVMVTQLLPSDPGPCGVEFIELDKGGVEMVASGAVVVATGGAGQLYDRTDNPARTTGDGYGLLYNTGATLQDMEFVQFYALGFADRNLPGWYLPISWIDEVPLTNSRGEEFLKALLPEWGLKSAEEVENYARDRAAVAVAKEWQGGRKVFLHLNQLPQERWAGTLAEDLRRLAKGRIDIKTEPVPVIPTQHFFCGGVAIGPEGETDIPGIFACGEVAAGLHGANRVGGNALSELVVFGWRAGGAAAAWARRSGKVRESLPSGNTAARIKNRPDAKGGVAACLRQELKAAAGDLLGVIRRGSNLAQAVAKMEEFLARSRETRARNLKELREALEVENLCRTGLLVAKGALLREESRGVHYRDDFPAENDADWKANICWVQGPDGLPRLKGEV